MAEESAVNYWEVSLFVFQSHVNALLIDSVTLQ